MFRLSIVLICCFFFCLSYCNYIDRSSPLVKAFAARVFEQGVAIESSVDITAAMGYYENSFEIAPSANTAYHLAQTFKEQQNGEAALFWLQKALEFDPTNITTLNTIGLIYHFSTNYATAIHFFSLAIQQTHSLSLPPSKIIDGTEVASTAEDAAYIASTRELVSETWFNLGVSQAHSGSILSAGEAYYQASSISNPRELTNYFPLGVTDASDAAKHVVIAPHFRALLNLAALHHAHGILSDGVRAYEESLLQMNRYNSALVSYRDSKIGRGDGRIKTAREVHWNMLVMTRSNLGAALIQNDQINDAEHELLAVYAYIHDINLHTCLQFPANTLPPEEDVLRLGECRHIVRGESHVLSLILNARLRYCNWNGWEVGWMRLLTDSKQGWMLILAGHNQPGGATTDGDLPTLTPFDSLLLPYISAADRLLLAVKTSKMITSNVMKPYTHGNKYSILKTAVQRGETKPIIRIGFLSYDFNSHPTAHLVEAIFVEINRCKGGSIKGKANGICMSKQRVFDDVELFIYSYGKDDNSTYRRNLENLADKFVDLSTANFEDSARMINSDGIDVLLEMQLHTLGHRLQITAHNPAPVQVSYLVYPGTAGATSFLSHIIADKTVIPIELHSVHYSEKMLLLPETYQVSFDGNVDLSSESTTKAKCSFSEAGTTTTRVALRRRFGLPLSEDAVVIMNFNKIDKLDPISFQVWVQMLQRIPTAVLWLLCPEDGKKHKQFRQGQSQSQSQFPDVNAEPQQNILTKAALYAVAKMYGISSTRIIFGNRTDKASHIQRHLAADVFVDTFIYGAHSTATDALRGGLPVLTVEGSFFPARVGASLYESLVGGSSGTTERVRDDMMQLKDLMVLPSLKEAEDMSIRLLRRRKRTHSRRGAVPVHKPAVAAARPPLTQLLLEKLTDATTPSTCNQDVSTDGYGHSSPIGFFDSAAAVSKLVYGLESLFESEALVIPESRFLSTTDAGAGARTVGIADAVTAEPESPAVVIADAVTAEPESPAVVSTHGHVVLCNV